MMQVRWSFSKLSPISVVLSVRVCVCYMLDVGGLYTQCYTLDCVLIKNHGLFRTNATLALRDFLCSI